jgi:hypothetical protein
MYKEYVLVAREGHLFYLTKSITLQSKRFCVRTGGRGGVAIQVCPESVSTRFNPMYGNSYCVCLPFSK